MYGALPGEIFLSAENKTVASELAAALFGDEELIPAKGQLVFLPPDPAIDYITLGGGRGQLYMFPRTDVLLFGGTFKPGDYSTHPEPEETERIIGEHQRLFQAFG